MTHESSRIDFQPLDTVYDTVIMGAGLIGSSVAYHLSVLRPGAKIAVFDVDLEGSLSSSELNAGGVRGTFAQEFNIRISKHSIDYYAEHARDVGYRSCGYLWLHGPRSWDQAQSAAELQGQCRWPVDVLDANAIQDRFPYIDKLQNINGAVFAPRDGLVNPNLLKNHYRDLARKNGVQFIDRMWLIDVQTSEVSASRFHLSIDQYSAVDPIESRWSLLRSPDSTPHQATSTSSRRLSIHCNELVNCLGAWAPALANHLTSLCPSKPFRRQISLFDCRDIDLTPYGMTITPEGVYFHPEATNGLAGFATPNEPHSYSFQYDGELFFQENIWPALYEVSTKFERLRHVTGWAGLYEVSPDESAIIGIGRLKSSPSKKIDGYYEAHSFSGHGAMHSYSAGLGLAELIAKGSYETLDFSMFSVERFDGTGDRPLLHETLVI